MRGATVNEDGRGVTVGGGDGIGWEPLCGSRSGSRDLGKPICPMLSVHWHFGIAKANGQLALVIQRLCWEAELSRVYQTVRLRCCRACYAVTDVVVIESASRARHVCRNVRARMETTRLCLCIGPIGRREDI